MNIFYVLHLSKNLPLFRCKWSPPGMFFLFVEVQNHILQHKNTYYNKTGNNYQVSSTVRKYNFELILNHRNQLIDN